MTSVSVYVDSVRDEHSKRSAESENSMSIKQDAQALVKECFKAQAEKDNCISAEQLTDLIAVAVERDYSSKTIRARLRKVHTRSVEQKNANWRITATVAQSEVEHYLQIASRQSKQAS